MIQWMEISIALFGVILILFVGYLVMEGVSNDMKYAQSYCSNITNGPVNGSRYELYCENGTVKGFNTAVV